MQASGEWAGGTRAMLVSGQLCRMSWVAGMNSKGGFDWPLLRFVLD